MIITLLPSLIPISISGGTTIAVCRFALFQGIDDVLAHRRRLAVESHRVRDTRAVRNRVELQLRHAVNKEVARKQRHRRLPRLAVPLRLEVQRAVRVDVSVAQVADGRALLPGFCAHHQPLHRTIARFDRIRGAQTVRHK